MRSGECADQLISEFLEIVQFPKVVSIKLLWGLSVWAVSSSYWNYIWGLPHISIQKKFQPRPTVYPIVYFSIMKVWNKKSLNNLYSLYKIIKKNTQYKWSIVPKIFPLPFWDLELLNVSATLWASISVGNPALEFLGFSINIYPPKVKAWTQVLYDPSMRNA